MTTIYIVTCGSYSDFHNVAAFSCYDNAKTLADKLDGAVEEYSLDPAIIYPSMPRFHVDMLQDGTVISVQNVPDMDRYTGMIFSVCHYEIYRRNYHAQQSCGVNCYAYDATHAIKIANEVRLRLTAENLWRFGDEISANFISQEQIEDKYGGLPRS